MVLGDLLDYILRKLVNQVILAISEEELGRRGGSYVDQRSPNLVGSNESRTAGQDHRDSGRDATTPMESENGRAA